MKILCLFVRHGREKHAGALDVLNRWYAAHGLIANRTLWVVDNALPPGAPPTRQPDGSVVLAGDNRAWEFSAWARTLQSKALAADNFDVVHLVTSAFNTLYTRYLEHFHPDMLGDVLRRQLCLGHIDSYDRPVEFASGVSASWIRTCFVFLPYTVARRIDRWAAFTDSAAVFSPPQSTEFRNDAPLSRDYQNRIRMWLEGRDVGGHVWHSPISSAPDEANRFQRKTLAILNEHSLSITLRNMGTPLVDFCWLHTTRLEQGSLPGTIPSEDVQLKVRRRILCIPEPQG